MASEDLLKKAVAAFNALSPEQQAEMMEEQRQSWVCGNVGLSRDERGMTSPVMPRPAPAATDTGLVTVAWRFRDLWEGGHKYWKFTERRYDLEETEFRALCDRSQAEELLAAKDAQIAGWTESGKLWTAEIRELQADNAALTARVKELEGINANLMGDDEDKPRYTTKRLKQEIARATEALEAKIAAANEVAQLVIQAEEDKSGDPNFYILMMQTAYDKARAVLGGKPS